MLVLPHFCRKLTETQCGSRFVCLPAFTSFLSFRLSNNQIIVNFACFIVARLPVQTQVNHFVEKKSKINTQCVVLWHLGGNIVLNAYASKNCTSDYCFQIIIIIMVLMITIYGRIYNQLPLETASFSILLVQTICGPPPPQNGDTHYTKPQSNLISIAFLVLVKLLL